MGSSRHARAWAVTDTVEPLQGAVYSSAGTMLAQAVCACLPQGEAGPSLGEKGGRHTGQLQTLVQCWYHAYPGWCTCLPRGEASPSLGERGARNTGQLQTLSSVLVPCLPRQCEHASHRGRLTPPWGRRARATQGSYRHCLQCWYHAYPGCCTCLPRGEAGPSLGGERAQAQSE